MKKVLLVSILAVMGMAACGEKSNLALKARERQQGKRSQKPDGGQDKTTPSFVALNDADNIKLKKNTQVTRQVFLDEESSPLNVLCTDNLELSLNEPARLKLLGGGQILLAQDTQAEVPKNGGKTDSRFKRAPKQMVNIICETPAAGTENLEAYDNVKTEQLTPGDSGKEIEGKFIEDRGLVQKIAVSCQPPEKLPKVKEILSEKGDSPIRMVLGSGTYLLFETSGGSSKKKNYVLVKCERPATRPMDENTEDPSREPSKEPADEGPNTLTM